MYHGKTIGAVIPAYNEESRIGTVIDNLPSFIDRAYVVDDGSTDDTWEEIQRHADRANETIDEAPPVTDGGVTLHPRIVPIRHGKNRGVGAAIKTGYRHALADGVDVTTVISGDGQTAPDVVERIVAPVAEGEAEYAKGNRLLEGDREDMPAFRQFGNFILSVLTKIASGYWKVMDPQNGSTAIGTTLLSDVDIDDLYDGYGFTNDLLVRLNVADARIADVSRRAVYADEESHIRYRSFVPRLSLLLLRRFLWRLRVSYLGPPPNPVGVLYPLGALATVGGIVRLVLPGTNDVVSGIAIFVGGITCLAVSMALDYAHNDHLQIRRYRQQKDE